MEYEYRDDLPSRNVTITRVEYASLLRDRALAEKVRRMARGTSLCHWLDGSWSHIRRTADTSVYDKHTPEAALEIEV